MTKTSIDSFADSMADILKMYTEDMERSLEDSKETVAKDGVKTLKVTSPKKTGRYQKGWRAKKIGTRWVVHNATDYQLTHLLEKGHAKVGGGRVPAYPHIGPVEDQIIVGLEKKVEEAIKRR